MKQEVYLSYSVERYIIRIQTKVVKLNSKRICCTQKNANYHLESLSISWYNVFLLLLLVDHQPLGGQVHELHTQVLSFNLVHHSSNVLWPFVSQIWHTKKKNYALEPHMEKTKNI
jgi:hypothetical protein